ncbi:glycosyltransferase family 2 protein [Magnetococcales bacterium HHB-1]
MNDLSIILTTLNRQPILAQALDALLATVNPDFLKEILIVDDGSQDSTADFLESFAQQQPNIRLLRHDKPQGPASARNAGIGYATGDWIMIMGDDVIFQPDAVNRLYHHAQNHNMKATSVIGNIQPWPEQMTPLEHWSSHGGSQFAHNQMPESKHNDMGDAFFYTSNILTSRQLLLDHPFDETFPYARYEDRELGYRLQKRIGHTIHYLPQAVSYHLHPQKFHNWLLLFEKFTWSALHFSRRYEKDTHLKTILGINKAIHLKNFSWNQLQRAIDRLNRDHPNYFQSGDEGEQIRLRMGHAFREIQEFFRIYYYRRWLKMSALRDKNDAMHAEEAVEKILQQLDHHL